MLDGLDIDMFTRGTTRQLSFRTKPKAAHTEG